MIDKPLLFYQKGGKAYLIASYGGSDTAPAWYLNLTANPEVEAQIGSSQKANAKILAQRIPGAILKELPGGHLFFTEFPELFNPLVIDFVRSIREVMTMRKGILTK